MKKGNTVLALRIFVNVKDVVNSISANKTNQKQNKPQTITHFKIELIFNINADE